MSAQVRGLTCWRGALRRRTWVSWWTAGHPWARSVPCWPERPMISWGALKRECSTLVRLHLEYVSSSWLLSSRNEDILQMSELYNILYIPATDEWVKTVFYKCSLFWIHIRNNHKKKDYQWRHCNFLWLSKKVNARSTTEECDQFWTVAAKCFCIL